MSDNSKIEWCTATWNPVLGCTRVSPGCDSCYAIVQARMRAANPNPKVAAAFAGLTEQTEARVDWTGKVNLLPERLGQPFGWKKPQLVFVNSLADLFHKNVPTAFIALVFAVMAGTPQHTYQVLTKQQGRMRALLNDPDFAGMVRDAMAPLAEQRGGERIVEAIDAFALPLPNVWIGVSVEDQKRADLRIPALLNTPAAVRFLSCEPLLGPVSLTEECELTLAAEERGVLDKAGYPIDGLDWVICGGESGPHARPMHPDWARQLRDECQAAGVPFFFKQWGAFRWVAGSRWDEATLCWVDHGIEPQRVPKKLSGRRLEGRTWDEFPHVLAGAA